VGPARPFLSSAEGTVHEKLRRRIGKVTEGGQGAYPMRGGERDASVTIEPLWQQIDF